MVCNEAVGYKSMLSKAHYSSSLFLPFQGLCSSFWPICLPTMGTPVLHQLHCKPLFTFRFASFTPRFISCCVTTSLLLSLGFPRRSSMLQLHSNPGDYAWGQGGLDAVITEVSDILRIVASCLSSFFYLFYNETKKQLIASRNIKLIFHAPYLDFLVQITNASTNISIPFYFSSRSPSC